jgi:hypothetical protein
VSFVDVNIFVVKLLKIFFVKIDRRFRGEQNVMPVIIFTAARKGKRILVGYVACH